MGKLIGSHLNFLNQLVTIRKSRMTQQEVADKMHVHRSVVARLEATTGSHSKNHTLFSILRYAEAVGVFIGHAVFDLLEPEEVEAARCFRMDQEQQLYRRRRKSDAPEQLPTAQAEKIEKSVQSIEFKLSAPRNDSHGYAQNSSSILQRSPSEFTQSTS